MILGACGGGSEPTGPGTPDPVATSVTVSPATVSLDALDATQQLSATVLDQNGATMAGATVSWTTSDPAAAAVSSSGLITAVANGTATVTATSGAASAPASVTVAQIPDSVAFGAVSLTLGGPGAMATVVASALDAGGAEVQGALFSWASSDSAVVTVDSAGVVTAVAAGTVDVTTAASAEGTMVSGTLPVVVNLSLEITTTMLADGDQYLPYADALEAGGGGVYTWAVTAGALPDGVTLASTGELEGTPATDGTFVFTASVSSDDGQAAASQLSLTIVPAPVLASNDLCSAAPANAIASFTDATLEGAVRTGLGLTAGADLTCTAVGSQVVLAAESMGITSVVGAQNLTGLEMLRLKVNSIDDLSPLAGLTNLTLLDLTSNPINDVVPLAGLTGLGTLYIASTPVADISSLSGLTGLVDLAIDSTSVGGQLSQLGVLANFTGLQRLLLNASGVVDADMSSLLGLTALAFLHLDDNPGLSDVQPLIDNAGLGAGDLIELRGGAPSLRCSDVAQLQGRGASVMTGLTFSDTNLDGVVRAAAGLGPSDALSCEDAGALTYLIAEFQSITDLAGIQNLTGLIGLELDNNALTDITLLSELTGLDHLRLEGNSITDLTPLAGFTGLSDWLDLSGNGITDIGPLSGLISLRSLFLSDNAISDLGPLSGLASLGQLSLRSNQIANLTPLSGLAGLQFLGLDDNLISNLSPLSGLTSLQSLSLTSNSIGGINDLSGLGSLRELRLGSNSLVDIGPLSGLTELAFLGLEGNSILDIAALSGLINLEELSLAVNVGLSNIQPLVDNAGIGSGDTVDLLNISALLSCAAVSTLEGRGVVVSSTGCT